MKKTIVLLLLIFSISSITGYSQNFLKTKNLNPDPKGTPWYLDGYGKPFKNMIILGLLILYLAGIVAIGLEISTWLFLVIALKFVKQDSMIKITLIPILVTLILFLIFKIFLDVWFPEPLIMEFFSE